jgi:hypothetical protein
MSKTDLWGHPLVDERRRPLLEALVQAGVCGPFTADEVDFIMTETTTPPCTEERWIVLKSVAFAIDLYLHELSGELNVLRFIGSSPSVGKVNARARILLKILKILLVDSDKCY